MTRKHFIERIRREIYGEMPRDDASITEGLVNNLLNDAIAVAAKTNYSDSIRMGDIGHVNNSFYIKFKNIAVTQSENFLWKVQLPQIPVGIGANEGVSVLTFKGADGVLSQNCVPLTQNQVTFIENVRKPQNKILYYSEGDSLYVFSTIVLSAYTANVTMVSGGDSTDLNSTLNVPPDYYPIMQEYLLKQLSFEQSRVRDVTEDGLDGGDRQ
jgi:hypothetical protein